MSCDIAHLGDPWTSTRAYLTVYQERLHREYGAFHLEEQALRGAAPQQLADRVAMTKADDDEFDVRVLGEGRNLVDGILAGAHLDRVRYPAVRKPFRYFGQLCIVEVPRISGGVALRRVDDEDGGVA